MWWFMLLLLPASNYGISSNYATITVREGEMAYLPINIYIISAPLPYHILIVRYNHSGLKERVLDCVCTGGKCGDEQIHPGFSLAVNDSSLLVLKINQTSKNDSGIYEWLDVSDKHVIFLWNVTVQAYFDADQQTSEGSIHNVYLSTLTPLKNGSGFSKCCHLRKKTETDGIVETKAEVFCKDIETMEKVDNNDINLQVHDNCLRIIIETKPRSEEQHQLRRENNRTETSASAATHMIVDEKMDLGENVNLRNKNFCLTKSTSLKLQWTGFAIVKRNIRPSIYACVFT